jgi:hypothetical protein
MEQVDRWQSSYNGGTVTQTQESLSSGSPYNVGFRNYFRVTNTTGSTSAGDYRQIYQNIEAQNISNSAWNYTSSSSYITLSFW